MSASSPQEAPPAERTREGTVIRSTGSWYDVLLPEGDVVPSKIRGRFRLRDSGATNPVAVGDRVTIRLNDDDTGLITDLAERHNALIRRAAGKRVGQAQILVANVDRAWVVQSVSMPIPNPGFIDRFLVMAEVYDIPAGILFNKADLLVGDEAAQDDIEDLGSLYAGLGYDVLLASALTGDGIEDVREALAGQTSVVSGPSGVGKSTLLNAVQPGLNLRTGEVSERTRKGKHTTTHAALFPLDGGGFVVDTPGIREWGVIDLEPHQLGHYFVEFRPFENDCRFPNCTHDHEPGCAVDAAYEAGEISPLRYRSYLNILESLRAGDKDVGR